MIKNNLVQKIAVLFAIPLIGLAAFGMLLYLMEHAFTHLNAQTSLIHTDEKAGQLHALEWGIISERKFNRRYLEDSETLKNDMTQSINKSLEMHLGEDISA
ncbi:MAG: hypothetical protein AAB281_04785, partial [Actinomycetota bacterium]